jgi:hypothetical protein
MRDGPVDDPIVTVGDTKPVREFPLISSTAPIISTLSGRSLGSAMGPAKRMVCNSLDSVAGSRVAQFGVE